MPDHTVMHVQFSSGVTIWQHVLKQMVNTLHIRGKQCKQMMCGDQKENSFCLNHQVFVNNNVKLPYFVTILTLITLHGSVH